MNENFSPRVKRLLIALAQDEAYCTGSRSIDPEHLILGLLKSADGLGYIALQHLRVNVLTLQLALEQSIPKRAVSFELKNIPNSQRTESLLRQADFISKSCGNDYVGTEHILLASIAEDKSIMNAFFKKAVISFELAKKAVVEVQRKLPSSYNSDDSGTQNESRKKFVPFMADGSSQGRQKKNNSILQQFSRDLTQESRDGKLEDVIGRDDEVLRMIQILCRKTKNNPVLIGEPGVGKTAIVEGLAGRIVKGDVPHDLLDKKIMQLDLAAMIAGTKYRGEFEERLKKVMKEIKETKNIILFVDELHTIIGAGGPEGSMDASNMIKPALSRGEMQMIGATTIKEYRKYFEKDSALVRRFQKVLVEEPSEMESIQILEGLKKSYENFHQVTYDDDVIPLIVKLSRRYINDRFLPDKALDILDESGAAKKINEESRPEELASLEEELVKLNDQKSELVSSQEYEKAAYIRDRANLVRARIDEVNRNWKNMNGGKNRLVKASDVCRIVSRITGIDVDKLDDENSERLLNMEKILHEEVIGQEEAIKLISSAVRRSKVGVSSYNRPIGSFIFLGPTGVGKTQLAKTLAKFLFGTEDALIRVDMSDFMEKQNASKLVGAPPGYVGYEEGGMLTEKVRQRPYSVVLLDEIEKAHKDIFNLLLQLLEEGELKDNLGHTISFRNTVVIMTSNAGAREITAESRVGFSTVKEGILPYDEMKTNAMEELKKIMAPELLNRVDDVIVFESLTKEDVSSILDIQFAKLKERLSELGYEISLKPKAREYLVEHGYEPSMGARPMRRLLQREIEDALASLLLSMEKDEESKSIVVDFVKDKLSLKFKKTKSQSLKKNLLPAMQSE